MCYFRFIDVQLFVLTFFDVDCVCLILTHVFMHVRNVVIVDRWFQCIFIDFNIFSNISSELFLFLFSLKYLRWALYSFCISVKFHIFLLMFNDSNLFSLILMDLNWTEEKCKRRMKKIAKPRITKLKSSELYTDRWENKHRRCTYAYIWTIVQPSPDSTTWLGRAFKQEVSAGLGLNLTHMQGKPDMFHGCSDLVNQLLGRHVPVILILERR